MKKVQEAIMHIEALYPPDSDSRIAAAIGRSLMDDSVGNPVGYNNWRSLSDDNLIRLAIANLEREGEYKLAEKLKP